MTRRVLMTADAVGGVWDYALQLADLMANHGTQTVLATMGPRPSRAQEADAAAVRDLDLRVSTFPLEWMPDAAAGVDEAGEWLLALEREVAPALIHLNGYFHAVLPWHAPVLVVAHSCVASWWHAVHGCPPPAEWSWYVEGVRRGLRAAHRIVAPSAAMRDALVRCYGAGGDATVIPNGRSPLGWRPARKEPFVLSAGRAWDPAKNIGAIDAAAAGLAWPVYLAGDVTGPGAPEIPLHHLRGCGRQSPADLARLMGRASIFAAPARYEPFGLSVLEAALCGCALVLGDIDSFRENWNGTARFVPPDDVHALHETLAELIADVPLRESLGERAHTRALSFSPEAQAAAYLRVYAELLHRVIV